LPFHPQLNPSLAQPLTVFGGCKCRCLPSVVRCFPQATLDSPSQPFFPHHLSRMVTDCPPSQLFRIDLVPDLRCYMFFVKPPPAIPFGTFRAFFKTPISFPSGKAALASPQAHTPPLFAFVLAFLFLGRYPPFSNPSPPERVFYWTFIVHFIEGRSIVPFLFP